jgi:hypothetical protein
VRTQIIVKLGAMAMLILMLILFAATTVDFVYTGF